MGFTKHAKMGVKYALLPFLPLLNQQENQEPNLYQFGIVRKTGLKWVPSVCG